MYSLVILNDILANKTDKSALAKHTGLFHRDKVGDPSIYQLKVNNTTKSSLLRQVREGQSITTAPRTLCVTGRGSGMSGRSPRPALPTPQGM